MTEVQDESSDLAGFQNELRSISALEVRIDYQSPRRVHHMRPKGIDWLFSSFPSRGLPNSGAPRPSTNLNSYAIRHQFEAADTPEKAVRFLSEAGTFWPWERVLWSEFQEWQRFFMCLRQDYNLAKNKPEGQCAWETAVGRGNTFFTTSDSEFTRARFTEDVIAEMGPENWNRNLLDDRQRLQNLRGFALSPMRAHEGSQTTINWYDPSDWLPNRNGIPPENWKERTKRAPTGRAEPYLQIVPLCILEAIAATIYADRVDGQRFGKCRHCGALFKIESGHGQQFCAAPPHLKSSPCKNAFTQHKRREGEKNAVDLIVNGKKSGLKKPEIERKAKAEGISLAAPTWVKAHKKLRA